ncbi:type I polyketide synthase [Streptomyces huasconensis]|uniref:type I polyketide synthase n=1 Tax=Streptomyces huasconensis TaxID=1854574 RepID=UPI00340CC61C
MMRKNRIAIIGCSFEFPNVRELDQLWAGLMSKRCFYHNTYEEGAERVEAWGSVDNLKGFDYTFFGFSYNEACRLDPQHRHLLQHCWWAMENAGYMDKQALPTTAVFASASENHYLWTNLADEIRAGTENEALLGNLPDFLATRIAWKLGATGQALTLQSGCSSGLAGLHHARVALLTGQAEMALVGAVSLAAPHDEGYEYLPSGIRSADGTVRPFDHKASGTVFTNGVAALVLKPLQKALAHGDDILGVIEGSALNNDGGDKAGFTAPSVSGQRRAIRHALRVSGIPPERVALYEAHGTGTQLGDPIEFAAATEAWAGSTAAQSTCALQSVKANLGHLDTVSGLAGVLKACLVLRNRLLPPQANFREPNPHIALESSVFFVNTEPRKLPDEECFATVSALGIGGTNAHVVIGGAPEAPVRPTAQAGGLFLLSAANQKALGELQQAWLRWDGSDDAIAKSAQITQRGRTALRVRQSVWADSVEELRTSLRKRRDRARTVQGEPAVVLMFTGQGSQYTGMGRHLYEHSAFFRDALDEKLAVLEELSGHSYHDILFVRHDVVNEPQHTQPALLALEVVLAEYLEHCGVYADLMLGHSLGEYSAMVVGQALSFRDAARLILRRAELVQGTAPGAMYSVMAGAESLAPLLDGTDLSVAAFNTSTMSVVSGSVEEIRRFTERARQSGLHGQPLKVDRAFHSGLLDPILPLFREALQSVRFAESRIPVVSTLTGHEIGLEQYGEPDYWLRQMREPVAFADAVRSAEHHADRLCFLEVGPGRTLKNLASQTTSHPCVNLLPNPADQDNAWRTLYTGFGEMWEQGVRVGWRETRDQDVLPSSPPLPNYPFQLTECWTTPRRQSRADGLRAYRKCWVPLDEQATAAGGSVGDWLLIPDGAGASAKLARELDADLRRHGGSGRVVEGDRASWAAALKDGPANIALLFHPDSAGNEAFGPLMTVLSLVKEWDAAGPRKLTIITRSAADVMTEPCPALAALSTAVKSLNQEYPALTTRLIDVDGRDGALLARELGSDAPALVVLRHSDRLTEGFLPLSAQGRIDRDRTPRSVVILGGGGQVGLQYARTFLENSEANVCLVQRSSLAHLKARDDETGRQRAARIESLMQRWPGRLMIREADVESQASLLEACRDAREAMGGLDTLVHTAGVDASMHYQLIKDVDEAFCRTSFAAKSRGLHNMAAAAASLQVEHCHVISSISATLGGIGMYVYGSLHAWLDAAVAQLRPQHPSRWTVLSWEAWEFGEDGELPSQFRQGAFGSQLDRYAMRPAEGRRVLWGGWSGLAGQQIVSSVDLQQRYEEWVGSQGGSSEPPVDEPADRAPRPEMSGEYHPAENDVERKITTVWESLLGLTGIGIDDNFFELGGHSLLALRMTGDVNKAVGCSLSMVDIFEYPTIRKLASGIQGSDELAGFDAVREDAASRARRRRQRQSRRAGSPSAASGREPS